MKYSTRSDQETYTTAVHLGFSNFMHGSRACRYGVSLSSTIFFISDANYRYRLLSQLHFANTSSHYNAPCITSFSFIFCFRYVYVNYRHLLLS